MDGLLNMGLSVVIPSYNEEALIGRCIDSVKKELENVFFSTEIIVVCNACTDDTEKIAREHGAIIVNEPRKGITFARQAGYLHAKYCIIANIDSDNVVPAGWLLKGLNAFVTGCQTDLGIVAVSGPLYYREMPLFIRALSFVFYLIAWVSHRTVGPMLQGGNFIVRKSALDKIGGYDTNIKFYGEDTDLGIRLAKVGKVRFNLDMWIDSSARRLRGEGIIKTTWNYVMSYLWITFRRKTYTDEYEDYRIRD